MENIKENAIGNGYAIKPSFTTSGGGRNGGGVLGRIKPYDFSIIPLNHSLETKPSEGLKTKNISIGDFIQGKKFKNANDNKIYSGQIKKIIKNSDDDVIIYVISDFKTNDNIELDAITIEDYKANHIQTDFRSQNTGNDNNKHKAIKIGNVY
ncbi:MAG: hypothetical protein RSF67_05205 [Clostridia bacterium]